MSRLGFNQILRKLDRAENAFLIKGIKAAQKSFDKNFKTESDIETGEDWDDVLRGVPPPILDVTGELRAQTTKGGTVSILGNRAILTIDPIDKRGRGYAAWHMEGWISQAGNYVSHRKFVNQPVSLDIIQKQILITELDRVFL